MERRLRQYEEQFLVQWPDGASSTAPTPYYENNYKENRPTTLLRWVKKTPHAETCFGQCMAPPHGDLGHIPAAAWRSRRVDPERSHETALCKIMNNNRAPFGPPPRRSHHDYIDYMPQNSWTEDPEWGTVCKDEDLLNEHHNRSQTLQPVIQELASTDGLACDVCVRQGRVLGVHLRSMLLALDRLVNIHKAAVS